MGADRFATLLPQRARGTARRIGGSRRVPMDMAVRGAAARHTGLKGTLIRETVIWTEALCGVQCRGIPPPSKLAGKTPERAAEARTRLKEP
jgi:hypothetical protein